MGRKKLLQKLSEFFNMDARNRAKHKEEMTELLARLKQKENELKSRLETETDETVKSELEQKIDLVHSQRKKGLAMLIELKDNLS